MLPIQFNKEIAELLPMVEGELIQNIYFLFKQFKLEPESCDEWNGMLIPTCENIQDMQEQLAKIFMDRHSVFVENDLYRFNFFHETDFYVYENATTIFNKKQPIKITEELSSEIDELNLPF